MYHWSGKLTLGILTWIALPILVLPLSTDESLWSSCLISYEKQSRRAAVLRQPGSVCEKLAIATRYQPRTSLWSIWTWWLLSFSFFHKLKISPDSWTEKNKLSACIYTEEKIFLIVFAILFRAMTSIFIILHGVSCFKKLSLPAVSVKRFSGAILGKSNSAFKCIFADII